MTDVIIVGGGPAGSSLAVLLGRAGLTVELYERGVFPKEKPCGEGIMPAGVDVLRRLGLADAVGGLPFLGVRYNCDGHVALGRFPSNGHGPALGIGQRRCVLDQALFSGASSTAGVAAFTGAAVDSLLTSNGRVTGAMVAGRPRQAKLVVAADGAQSRIRAQLGWNFPSRRKRIGMRAHFKLPVARSREPWVDVFVAPGHEIYVTPLPGDELLVAALTQGDALTTSPLRAFRQWCGSHRGLAARLEGAEQITELLTTSPLSCRTRHGGAPGIVLLGDAAGSCDPVTGGGIAQALVTAELLANYITRHGLEDQQWLAAFQSARHRVLRDYARLTRGLLWLTQHPRLARHAVGMASRAPRLVSHLVGVAGGTRALFGGQFSPASSMRV